MAELETFIDEVEIVITDSLDSLSEADTARLYADILDVEQRLNALQDALFLLADSRG
ncbi:MAG TPA: hypothetical protein VHL53_11740 [Acidimicrobiia bacterium]|nr:hypothetical protein [Acidimicrobiia bacterium]